MKSKKILVTGSDGYIGTVLVKKLIEQGFEVTGLDAGYYRGAWLFDNFTTLPKTITKDTRNVTVEDLKGYGAIVHLAELSNDPLGQLDEELTYLINHQATVELAKKAKSAGVSRFVYSSSCSVYGASDKISDESSPTNPQTAYAKCKLLNEQVLSHLAGENFTPVFLRNATVYGPSPRIRFDLVVNNLCGVAFTTREVKMQSDGSAWRPFVHVDDVANAMLAAVVAPKEKVFNQIFNIGDSNSNFQIKEIARTIAERYPDCKVSMNAASVDTRNYKVNFDKAKNQLVGFTPSKTVPEGIKELFDLFEKISLDKETFESRHYTRLKQILHLKDTKQIDSQLVWQFHYEKK